MLYLLDKLSSKLQKSDADKNTQGNKEKKEKNTHLCYNYSIFGIDYWTQRFSHIFIMSQF